MPDLRGRIRAGLDNMGGTAASRLTGSTISPNGTTLGAAGGVQNVSLAIAELPAHQHGGVDHFHAMADHTHHGSGNESFAYANAGNLWGYAGGSGNYLGAVSFTGLMDAARNTGAADRSLATGFTGSNGAHQNMPPTMLFNAIIKL